MRLKSDYAIIKVQWKIKTNFDKNADNGGDLMDRSNSDKFLIIYNDLDKHMRECLQVKTGTPNSYLINQMAKNNRAFAKYKEDLLAFSRLRNAIIHNPFKKDADPIAEPHENVVKLYEDIKNQLTCPPSALSTVAVPRRNIYATSLESKVIDVMNIMVKKSFSHVPVLYDDRIVGIFSESTFFSYVSKNEDIAFSRDTLIGDFKDYIDVNGNVSEYYQFVEKGTLLIDVEEMFQGNLKDNKRLAVVFITENGKQNERLLGLVTVWDLAGYCR